MGNIRLSKVSGGGVGGGSIATLTDVTLTSLANDEILQYNSTSLMWENINLGTLLDDSYLRLDCANSPLTNSLRMLGDLTINNDVIFSKNSYTYTMTAAPILYGGQCYDFNFDEGASFENHYFLNDKTAVEFVAVNHGMGAVSISSLDGTNDVGVALCNVFGALFLTIYFKNDDFTDATDFDTWFEGVINEGGAANTVDYFRKSIFTAGTPDYTWANPDGVSLCSNETYIDPPEISGTPATGFSYDFADASIDINGDLSNQDTDAIWWTKGLLSIGANQENPVLPKEQMGMNVQPYFTSTSGTIINVGAGFSPILAVATDSASTLYGLFGSLSLTDASGEPPTGVNFTGNYGALNFTNFYNTTGNVGTMSGVLLGLVSQQTGGTLTQYKGMSFNIYAGGGTSNLTNLYFYEVPQINSGWTVTNAYGIKIDDNTSKATTSWGIYNADRTLLGKILQMNDAIYFTQTDGYEYIDSLTDGYLDYGATIAHRFNNDIYPATDDTYYLGKNDDDTPFAWKGVILKDTTNGKYYRIEVISGTITATDLTD